MITAASNTAATGSSPTVGVSTPLDREAFLKLLITQLRYQNPMSPMEDKEFIAQLAQFSSLEQMQNMNKTLGSFLEAQALPQAVGMIGHTITAIDPGTGDKITDEVKGVVIGDEMTLVTAEGKEIPVSYVISVE